MSTPAPARFIHTAAGGLRSNREALDAASAYAVSVRPTMSAKVAISTTAWGQ
jgi:hypothetical protein